MEEEVVCSLIRSENISGSHCGCPPEIVCVRSVVLTFVLACVTDDEGLCNDGCSDIFWPSGGSANVLTVSFFLGVSL